MIKITKNKVAIEPVDNPDKIGSLFIPDQAQGRAKQGIVKYTGEDVEEIEIGDYVLFSPYNGTLVILQDEGRIIIIHEDFITCKIDPPWNLKQTIVPGLFFQDKNGNSFPATYEMSTGLIADMIKESPFRKNSNVLYKYRQNEKEEFRKREDSKNFEKDR